ncbi:MAG: 6-phosphogluconolactonase [Planctomycetota bacterium]
MIVADDYTHLSQLAADHIGRLVKEDPQMLLCAATGGTPTGAYERLAEGSTELFAQMRILKLDEWCGIPGTQDGSCDHYLSRHLLEPLKVTPDRYFRADGDAKDLQAECARMSEALRAEGPIGLCVLGLGMNGHLGFNEPGDRMVPHWHVVELTDSSLAHPMIQGSGASITLGVTTGMQDILDSRQALLLVSGGHKSEAMKRFLTKRVTPQFPASYLWEHPNLTVICDRDAVPSD